ncbi:oxidoreductase-like domain-containing protein [Colwellia sp. MEBiC06753]
MNDKKPEKLLEKPKPPADGECCDSACNPCVWDHYYAAMQKWRIQQAKLKEQEQEQQN